MRGYINEDLPPAELARQGELAAGLADSVRQLIRATVITDVGEDELAAARRLVDEAAAIVGRAQLDESFGVRFNTDGTRRNWGNAVEGIRNPIAPPVDLHHDDGLTWAEFELGPQYEGPPGLVHGGVVALVLDQVLGSAGDHAGSPGMTGTLTVRYRQGTKLGAVRAEARLDRVEGVKTFIRGQVSTADGVCAEAEGIFILPRWARGLPEKPQSVGD